MRLIIWTACLTLLAGTAGAQQRPALNFDPNRIEFATPWAQSSPCLGDASDPLCLAQTAVVCAFLLRRAECTDGRFGRHFNPQDFDRVEYRILRAGIVPLERLEAMQEALLGEIDVDLSPMTKRRAVVAQISMTQSACFARDASCEGHLATGILIVVERTRRGWVLQFASIARDQPWFAD